MLDLSKNDPAKVAEAGYEFTVVMPDGTETDAKITVRGQFSPAVKAYGRKMYAEYNMRVQAAKRRGKEVEDLTLEEAEDLAVKSAAVRVIGWKGLGEGDKEIAFSKDECERILKAYPFIREQVMKESDEITNFRHD